MADELPGMPDLSTLGNDPFPDPSKKMPMVNLNRLKLPLRKRRLYQDSPGPEIASFCQKAPGTRD